MSNIGYTRSAKCFQDTSVARYITYADVDATYIIIKSVVLWLKKKKKKKMVIVFFVFIS